MHILTKSKRSLPLAILAFGAISFAGGAILNGVGASAQSTTTTSTTAAVDAKDSATENPANEATEVHDKTQGGHVGTNGVKEAVLTGDILSKATTAAQAAVPGATVDRAENDAEGATYEVHMTKQDGSEVTVKLDASFKVTATEAGHGMTQ
jgi:uncharacterized membrane protein YkoI